MRSGVFGHESEPAGDIQPGICQGREPILGGGGLPRPAAAHIHAPCLCVAAGRGMPPRPMVGCWLWQLPGGMAQASSDTPELIPGCGFLVFMVDSQALIGLTRLKPRSLAVH